MFIITLPSAYVPRLLTGTHILNNTYLFHHKHSLLCLWFHYIRDITLLYPHILSLKNIECYIKAFQTSIATFGYFPEDAITEEKVSFCSAAYLQIYTNEGKPKSVYANFLCA